MDPPPIIEAKPVSDLKGTRTHLSPRTRLLIAGGAFLALAAGAFGVYIFAMLMFTFSLDGANSQKLPIWVGPYFMLGFPLSLGVAVLVTPLTIAFRVRLRRAIVLSILSLAFPIVVFIGGWIAMIVAIT